MDLLHLALSFRSRRDRKLSARNAHSGCQAISLLGQLWRRTNERFEASASLTDRNLVRVELVVPFGKAIKDLAADLFLSAATIETDSQHICSKPNLRWANELLAFVIKPRSELT